MISVEPASGGLEISTEGTLIIQGMWPYQRLLVNGQDLGSLLNDLFFEMSSAEEFKDRSQCDLSNTAKYGTISITILKSG